jgi:tetratricopeptide (TPR) repeat protein
MAVLAQDAAPAKPEAKEASPNLKPVAAQAPKAGDKGPTDAEIAQKLTGDLVADTKFYYSIGRHDKALALIDSATGDMKTNPDLLFTKANILALRREWDAARAIYESLLPVWPDTSTIGGLQTRFNLAEVYYVLGQHAKSLELYEQIWAVSKDKKDTTVDYLRYKMFLTNLVLGNKEKSDEIFQGFDEYSLEPSYYYATAAKAFKAGRTDEGKEWIRSAWNIYNEVLNNAFNEALLESTLVDRSVLEQEK